MRLKARHHGYRLNQRGIYKDVRLCPLRCFRRPRVDACADPASPSAQVSRGSDGLKLTSGVKIPCKSEQEIFAVLNVPYRSVVYFLRPLDVTADPPFSHRPPTERMP